MMSHQKDVMVKASILIVYQLFIIYIVIKYFGLIKN